MDLRPRLRTHFKSILPEFAIRRVKKQLWRYWMNDPLPRRIGLGSLVGWTSFEAAFPSASKSFRRACRYVPAPYLENKPLARDAQFLRGSHYAVPEDFVSCVSGAFVSSTNSVVLSPDRRIVETSSNCGQRRYLYKREMYSRRPIRIAGLATVFRSRYHNYYHLLVDCLPRLLAIQNSVELSDRSIKLLCSVPLSPVERSFLKALELNSFDITVLEKNRLYRPDRLLFTPLKTQRMAGYLPHPYGQQIRSRFVPQRKSRQNRRLFISRLDASYRRVENRRDLLDALHPLGFEEITLSDKSVRTQAELLYDAEVVVASHGAGLTNLLFAQKASVVELFPTPVLTPHYYLLSISQGHHYRSWHGTGSDLYASSFPVDVDQVLKLLYCLGIS